MSQIQHSGVASINFEDSELSAKTTKIQFGCCFKSNLKALSKAVDSVKAGKKNPVAALNELGLGESYRLLKQSGFDHYPIFTVAVTVADMTFEGCGHRKRVAKASAARTCLNALLARADSNPEPEPDFTSDEMYPGSEFQCFEAKIQPPEVNDKKASPPPDSELSAKTTKIQFGCCFKSNLKALSKAVDSVKAGKKNPVAALNELGLGESYRLLKQSGFDHYPIFTVAVTVADMTFEGCGHRKREAKASAARTCLNALLARADSNPEPEPDFTSDEMYPGSEFQCFEAKIQPPEVNDKKASPPPDENYLDSQETSSERNVYDKAELAENIKRSYLHGASNDTPQQAVPPTNSIVTDNDEDTKIADEMFRQLERECSDTARNYFEVVIDPNSFSRSMENIYHLSCLVNDGRLAVFIDDDGMPVIQTLNNKTRRLLQNQNEPESQFVVSMDMKRWKELIEVFEITEPFFK